MMTEKIRAGLEATRDECDQLMLDAIRAATGAPAGSYRTVQRAAAAEYAAIASRIDDMLDRDQPPIVAGVPVDPPLTANQEQIAALVSDILNNPGVHQAQAKAKAAERMTRRASDKQEKA